MIWMIFNMKDKSSIVYSKFSVKNKKITASANLQICDVWVNGSQMSLTV